MSRSNISVRVDLLRTMDEYIRNNIGDEEILDVWLQYGIPDGTESFDDFYELAADVDTFNYIAHQFGVILREYC
jgi:hypothetical protein